MPKNLKHYSTICKSGLFLLLLLLVFRSDSQDKPLAKLLEQAEQYKQEGEYKEALALYQSALKKNALSDKERAKLLLQIGIMYNSQLLGDKQKKLSYLQKAEKVAKKSGDNLINYQISNQLGIYYEVDENYPKAEDYYQKALSFAQKSEQEYEIVSSKLHLALIKILRGDYYLAIDYLLQMEDKLQDSPKRTRFLAVLYNNLSVCYDRLKDSKQAIKWQKKALQNNLLFFQKPNHPSLLINYNNLASHYLNANALDSAQRYLNHFFEYADERTSVYRLCTAYRLQGSIKQAKGQENEALALFEKARKMYAESYGSKSFDVAFAQQLIAENYLAKKDFSKALANIQKGLIANHYEFAEDNWQENPPIKGIIVEDYQLELLDEKLNICLQAYQAEQAIQYLQQGAKIAANAIAYIDHLRRQYSTEKTVLFVGEKALETYQKALRVYYLLWQKQKDEQYLAEAFKVIEKSKSYQLMRSLNAQTLRQNYASNSLIGEENRLLRQINLLQSEIAELERDSLAEPPQIQQKRKSLAKQQSKREELLAKIAQKMPNYYQSRFAIEPLSLARVQAQLNAKQAFIAYFLGDTLLYKFAIGKEKVHLEAVKLPPNWQTQIPRFRESIIRKDFDTYRELAYALYQKLWLNEEHLPQPVEEILLIPDGAINYLPMECLISQKASPNSHYKDLDYLIKRYQLRYHYSASLAQTKAAKSTTESTSFNITAFAPSFKNKVARDNNNLLSQREITRDDLYALPAAQKEVKMLSDYFSVNAFVGNTASKANFEEFAPQSKVLHLATHAVVDDRNTLRSRLLLSQDSTGDQSSEVYVYELKNMQLNAELVTLSACNTGIGNIQKGEGVMSLARAFMNAGAQSVLMSLWAVSDQSTADLMNLFYKNLSEGMDKAQALRQAKLQYLAKADRPAANPYYWASFVLIGKKEGLSVSPSRVGGISYWLLAGLVFLLLAFALIWWQSRAKKTP